MQNIIKTMCTT